LIPSAYIKVLFYLVEVNENMIVRQPLSVSQAEIQKLVDRATSQASDSIQEGNFVYAEQLLRQLKRVVTNVHQADHLLALSLHKQNKNEEADEILKTLLMNHTEHWEYWNTLGAVCSAMHEHSRAYAAFTHALKLNSTSVAIRNNMALEHQATGNYTAAKQVLAEAMEIPSKYVPMLKFNYGNVLLDDRQPAHAAKWFKEVRNLLPDFTPARWNRATALLMAGLYKEGWEEYESRWSQFPNFAKVRERLSAWPTWTGQPLEGKAIYLYAEQGAGDAIQFVRFAKQLQEQKAYVVMEWNSTFDRGDLSTILRRMDFIDKVVDPAEPGFGAGTYADYDLDYHQSVSSLPHVLGLCNENDMACEPYIDPDTEFAPELEDHIWKPYENKFKIGIVWAGSPTHHNDSKRSCYATQFWPFCHLGDKYQIFGLQKDKRKRVWEGKEVDLCKGCEGMPIVDLSGMITDYNSTANLISKMDLIVTVDSSIAHLAGGMGKPTFLMLPLVPDWRWGLESSETVWYSSVRIFRQRKKGKWWQAFDEAVAAVPSL
jgi:tetratricopeptide (TPR) repeat protein